MLMLNVTICKFLLAGHGNLTVQTPSIRCRKEKTHSNECVFLLETGIYISSQAVSTSHFAILLVIRKSNTIHHATAHSPKCRITTNIFQNFFSDAFAFGRVLLFAKCRPKLDLPFQIILGKKINAPPFPLSRIFNTHKSKQRCAYRFVGNLQVIFLAGHL